MSEVQNPAANDQLAQLPPHVEVAMAPEVPLMVPLNRDSIVDPAAVGLPDQQNGTKYTILEQLSLGTVKEHEQNSGVGLFVVKLTNPSGVTEYGIMGSTLDQEGNVRATSQWESISASTEEFVVGRDNPKAPKGHDDAGNELNEG